MQWEPSDRDAVVKALAVTSEITGTNLSEAAISFMLSELQSHPARLVVNALKSCARECKGRLTLGDVIAKLTYVDRKALSDARATKDIYLTKLRGCALVERIEFNARNPEETRMALEARGYKFGPLPEEQKQVRSLPHWTETDE